MNVLAIDQGTSSTKALVVAEGGEVLGESSAAVNPRPGPGGAVEQDPQELLESIVAAGRTNGEKRGDLLLARFRSTGALDPSFGGGSAGLAINDLGTATTGCPSGRP